MTNALDLVKATVAKWRFYRGNQTTYLSCQHFDGWYVQWAYEGFSSAAENNIVIYPSAIAAARASKIFTKDVNDPSIKPGDLIYWNWGLYGHVGTVVGRDGKRTLVSHTSHSGDALIHLGNNVRIAHADTISLDVYGVSHTNGANKPRSGLTGYNINQPKPTTPSSPAPAGGTGQSIDLRDGWAWYSSRSDAEAHRNPHGPQWTGELMARGVYKVIQAPDAIQVRANDGSSIWISPKARGRISGAPKPGVASPPRPFIFDVPKGGQYFYTDYNKALNGQVDRHNLIPGNYVDLRVLQIPGTGPIKVKYGNRHVWVGTRRNPARYRRS